MIKVKVKQYSSVEEYNFDYGFDITADDMNHMDNKNNYEEDNKIFSFIKIVYVKVKNNKFFMGTFKKYNKTFSVGETIHNPNIKEGYYIKESNGEFIELKNAEDYGEGLFELMLDTKKCASMVEEIELYEKTLLNKYNISWISRGRNSIEKIHNPLTKEEIIKDFIDTRKQDIDKEIKEKLIYEKERIEKEKKAEETIKHIETSEQIEICNDNNKIVYDKPTATLIYYSPLDKPKLRFKFKSNEYMKEKVGHTEYIFKSFSRRNKCKSLADRDCSFEYAEFDEKQNNFIPTIEYDFENSKFNGVKVAKSKMLFLINRTADNYNDTDITPYRNKEYIAQLNRLSGIKVDVCSLNDIKVNDFNIPVSVNMIDRETFEVEIMNEKKRVEWNILKEILTYGHELNTNISKGQFIKFVRALGLSDKDIKDNLDRVKMFHKLKGVKENE